MLSTNRRWTRLAVPLAAISLIAAACGDDDSSSDTTAAPATTAAPGATSAPTGPLFEQLDLSSLDISVGSKDFTEQLVLGEMLVAAFEAAGANVENRVDLGGTVVNREALLSGQINTYAEYNGTGWSVHLGNDDPSFDSEELTRLTSEQDLAENNIRWIGRSPFNDTYGFASSPDLLDNGQPFTMQSMADYLAANPDTVVCMESEFPDRPDGLILFENATGYEVPDSQVKILDTGIIYTETRDGNCDFGEVFTTDGRIAGLGLNLVDDPGIMILYNVSITMRNDLYEQAPDAFETIAEAMFAPLDNPTMTQLNYLVDIEGQEASEVARNFLVEQGLISG
jgi:osmoprotectant transport system substrate-binding protein